MLTACPAGFAAAATSLGNLCGAPIAYAVLYSNAGSREVFLGTTLLIALCGLLPGRLRPVRFASVTAILLVLLLGSFFPWNPDLLSSGPYLYGALYAAAGTGSTIEQVLLEMTSGVVAKLGLNRSSPEWIRTTFVQNLLDDMRILARGEQGLTIAAHCLCGIE